MSATILSEQIELGPGDAMHTVAVGRRMSGGGGRAAAAGGAGEIVLTATSPGLKPGKVAIRVSEDEADSPLAVAGADLTAALAFD